MPYPYPPLVPESPAELAARLGASLGRAWRDVQARYDSVLASANLIRKQETLAQLAELLAEVERFQAVVGATAARLAGVDIPVQYAVGAQLADRFGSPFRWTAMHEEAAGLLGADSYNDLLRNSEEAGRTSQAFARQVRAVARERGAFTATGRYTSTQVGAQLADRLRATGLSVVTYANGAQVPMGAYSEMMVLTKSAVAANAGSVNRYAELGIGWVEIMDGANCFVGDTRLGAYGGLTQIIRQRYDGPAVTLSVGTQRLTVGPNHPVLTTTGWRSAKALRPGDQVINDSAAHVPVSLAAGDLVQMPSVEDTFASLLVRGARAESRLARPNDLHGDAPHGHGEVEVVTTVRGLLLEGNASGYQEDGKLLFTGTDADLQGLPPDSARFQVRQADLAAPVGVVSGGDLYGALLGIKPGPLSVGAAGAAAERCWPAVTGSVPWERDAAPSASDVLTDRQPRATFGGVPSFTVQGHAGDGAPRPRGLSGGRTASGAWRAVPVLSVQHHAYSGWMYDASAAEGVLSGNGIVLKNCGWTSHDDTDKANGSIRTLEDAANHPIAHPRCRRALGARPDVTSAREAAAARASTTAEQRADQAASEAVRAAAVAPRAAVAARSRRAVARATRTAP